jgi:hypothetical protein
MKGSDIPKGDLGRTALENGRSRPGFNRPFSTRLDLRHA